MVARPPRGPSHCPCALRSVPLLVLPLLVGLLQAGNSGVVQVQLVILAGVLGAVFSLFLPRPRTAFVATLFGTLFVLAFSHSVADGSAPSAPQAASAMPLDAAGTGAVATGFGAAKPARALAFLSRASGALARGSTSWPLENLSVVLPCAFEGGFAAKTVEAVLRRTSHTRLHEIIVVDDGSRPPLRDQFPRELLNNATGAPIVRIIRHEETRGLIGAKKTGGDAATGDVIVFFDCHVSPTPGWEEAFLRQMKRAGDHRTVVVPSITSLDPDTWQQIAGGVGQACYLLWSGDFTWLARPGRDVPLMSGGLLALSRQWWLETGGYDEHMVAWGGENIDQSLRTWLCGGRIELAEGATVAHMWRDPSKPKTTLKYPIPTKQVMRNKARAISAWFGEFKEKTFTFPEYGDFLTGANTIGDMSNFDALKGRLQCQPFSSYISRFSYVYLDTGLLPEEVFQIREKTTGLCLERAPNNQQPHGVELAPCAAGESGDLVHGPLGVTEKQLWHLGNRDRTKSGGTCCSGIMNWNFLQCLDALALGGELRTYECAITGESPNQFFHLSPEGDLKWRDTGCVGISEQKLGSAGKSPAHACTARVVAVTDTVGDVLRPGQVPGKFKLQSNSSGELTCAVPGQSVSSDAASWLYQGWELQFRACKEADTDQVFRATPMLGGHQIRTGNSGFCLDAASGGHLLVYPCYDEKTSNFNQVWHIEGSLLVWHGDRSGYCVDLHALKAKMEALPLPLDGPVLQTCAWKPGQRFHRRGERKDGAFLLAEAEGDMCLCAAASATGLRLCTCEEANGPEELWVEMKDLDQVRHMRSGRCLDSGNDHRPSLRPCQPHDSWRAKKQRFRLVEPPGWLQAMGDWGDNGRKRDFETCIDFQAQPGVKLSIIKCASTQRMRWERLGARAPPERLLWQRAAKVPPGSAMLGGSAEPPVM